MSALPPLIPLFRAVDATGTSLPFALLYTYAAGTVTPLATYQDAAGTVSNSNPVICDANGVATVYLPIGIAYKFSLTDQYGTVQPGYPVDNIVGGSTGASGAAGSIWRNGTGAPSNAVGVDGDYYLNDSNGDVYKRSGGAYAIVANIQGPVGSSRNVINNGSFYQGLLPWGTSGAVPPTLGTGRLAVTGSAQQFADPGAGAALTNVGSIFQGFTIQQPSGTQNLTFWEACYLSGTTAFVSNTGIVKVYLFDAQAGTETLIGTYNKTASSATAAWTQHTIDVTANLTQLGDYGLRFEITAVADNTGGTGGSHGTYMSVDDVKLVLSSAGSTNVAAVTIFTAGTAVTPVNLVDAPSVLTDATKGNIFYLLTTAGVGATRTMAAPTGGLAGQTIEYRLQQDSIGSRAINWNGAFKFPYGAPFVASTNANAVDILTFTFNAVTGYWESPGRDVR
jgi:hypothetical protein